MRLACAGRRNTDGVALTQAVFGPFPSGAFYAVPNDGYIAAFSWGEIAEGLGLRATAKNRFRR